MQGNGGAFGPKDSPAEALARNRAAIGRLARSGEARQLMAMLERQGGVQDAARSAATGDTAALTAMMNRLMGTREGAELVERIADQAKRSGLN